MPTAEREEAAPEPAAGPVRGRLNVYAAAATMVGCAVGVWLLHHRNPLTSDSLLYAAMAEGDSLRMAPFEYRPLTPWLVWVLPFSTRLGFELVTTAGMAGALIGLWWWLRARVGDLRAYLGCGVLALSGGFASLLEDPYLTDPLLWAAIVAALLLLDRERWVAFALVVAAGVLAREAMLVLLVVPYGFALENREWRRWWLAVPGLVTFAGVRFLADDVIGRNWKAPGDILAWRAYSDGSVTAALLIAVFCGFSVLWVATVHGHKALRGQDRWLPVYAVATLLPCLIAGDWVRISTAAFPAVALAATSSRWSNRQLMLALAVQAAGAVWYVAAR